ncbi:MAG: hypothetical protein WCP79_14655 [Bacillota bacterium]
MKTSAQLENDIWEINKRCCQELFEVVSVAAVNKKGQISGLSPRLVIPNYNTNNFSSEGVSTESDTCTKHDGEVVGSPLIVVDEKERLSEQEARFIYASVVNLSTYYYSIETPTMRNYNFTKNTATETKAERSALSDLTIYDFENEKLQEKVNVEFKAHNCAFENIRKDIEKLLREPVGLGNWFHVFENADIGTIGAVFEKFKEAIISVAANFNDVVPKTIIFTLVVKNMKFAIMRKLEFSGGKLTHNASDMFAIYEADGKSRSKNNKGVIQINPNNNLGWTLVENDEAILGGRNYARFFN